MDDRAYSSCATRSATRDPVNSEDMLAFMSLTPLNKSEPQIEMVRLERRRDALGVGRSLRC